MDILTPCNIEKNCHLPGTPAPLPPRRVYYRRTFQTLSNVPNICFDNSIRWLPRLNGSNLREPRHTLKAQTIMAGREKQEDGRNKISLKKFINNSPCTLESCCLFNNAWPPQVSLPALKQMQRALWVNMETREEDKPDPHQSDDPPTWSAASH